MATKAYAIADLLEGKYYRSLGRHIDGIIQYAEKREGVWYGENYEAYLVTVRPHYEMGKPFRSDFYATVAVKISED
jgi:hypothetical protein